jgi:very-short-patch-repair endonuclease
MKLGEMKELFSTFIKSPETIVKTKNTSLEKYGENHYFKTDACKLGMRKKAFTRLYLNWSDYLDKLKINCRASCLSNITAVDDELPLSFKCDLCENTWEEPIVIMPICPKCANNFTHSRSKEEAALLIWLKHTIKEEIVPNQRFTQNGKTYEADVVIEAKKLIIELNGLFWHGERCGKDKTYHIKKYDFFRAMGYEVIQIFEDEWILKTDLVKKKLLHKLGYNTEQEKIYARKCIIKEITNKISNDFLDTTHLQSGTNASYCYGAFYNEALVAVMTFSRLRRIMGNKINSENEYEIVRFSTISDKRVIGVAGKILSVFKTDRNPTKIVSYADRRWTSETKNLYLAIRMKLVGKTEPNYWYVKKLKREYRFKYTKKKLIQMGYDSSKTEWEIMQEIGYDRIWDCGNYKFEKTYNI